MEHAIEQQLEGRTRLCAEVDLTAVSHDIPFTGAEGDHVGLILQVFLAKQPSALQDLLARVACCHGRVDPEAGTQTVRLIGLKKIGHDAGMPHATG